MDERLLKFLDIVPLIGYARPGKVWAEQFRAALSEGFVRIGFGGRVLLTEAGEKARQSAHQ